MIFAVHWILFWTFNSVCINLNYDNAYSHGKCNNNPDHAQEKNEDTIIHYTKFLKSLKVGFLAFQLFGVISIFLLGRISTFWHGPREILFSLNPSDRIKQSSCNGSFFTSCRVGHPSTKPSHLPFSCHLLKTPSAPKSWDDIPSSAAAVKRKRRPCQNGAMVIGFPTLVSLSPSRLPGSDPVIEKEPERSSHADRQSPENFRNSYWSSADHQLMRSWSRQEALNSDQWQNSCHLKYHLAGEILEGAKISKRRIFVLIIGCLSNKEARHHFPKFDRQSNARRRRSKKRRGTSKARRSHWSLCQSLLKKCCLFIWNLK